MIVSYFDETGLNHDSNVVCVAGLIGTAIEWARLEKPWKDALQEIGVSTFHANKCRGGNYGHGEYHGKPETVRNAHFEQLCNEMVKRDLGIVVAAVAKNEWEQYAPLDVKERFQTPYHFCVEFVMQKVGTWSLANAGGEPVAVVVADHEEYHSRVAEVHGYYFRNYPQVGTLTFGKPKCLIQLQAADLLCHETYRYMLERLGSGVEPKLSAELTKLMMLLKDPADAGFYDRDNLPKLRPTGAALE